MKVALITGGTVEEAFVFSFLKEWKPDRIIGIDRGLEFLYQHGIQPDLIVGDFDSIQPGILEHFRGKISIRTFVPEKDASDTEIGIREALDMKADEIAILGGTGSRLDHVLANIQTLVLPLQQGVRAFIQDAHNRIRLLDAPETIQKEQMFGKYISFFPLAAKVEKLTLEGFKYCLKEQDCTGSSSLFVSNELERAEAVIRFESGILIMIESRD